MSRSLPREVEKEHTRILRVMLATEDCIAYWKRSSIETTGAERVRVAFEQRWFGNKSESRVRTLLGDMALRFDAYPVALRALRIWNPSREEANWVCHLHTQLADPIYRRFTADFLPQRRQLGYLQVDREGVARWAQEQWPGRWSPATCLKFGSNLLATAYEVGLLKDRKDPRRLVVPRPPQVALDYALHLLRELDWQGAWFDSAYLRSMIAEPENLESAVRGLDSVRLLSLGDLRDIEWRYPDLITWAEAQASVDGEGDRT